MSSQKIPVFHRAICRGGSTLVGSAKPNCPSKNDIKKVISAPEPHAVTLSPPVTTPEAGKKTITIESGEKVDSPNNNSRTQSDIDYLLNAEKFCINELTENNSKEEEEDKCDEEAAVERSTVLVSKWLGLTQ